ncbi:tetratricopeptide repeat-containing diguanylate cyclase [Terrisporobacter glycolicus]|uniref:tetratricopeptide repeat-containing diguanylate cyclase n=1 Tax=Terrisporobacter glycolicus TaxID=36841 RepID=UPI000B14BBAD
MKKKKKFILLLVAILTIICSSIYFISYEKKISTENMVDIDEITNDILKSKIENYDEEKLKNVKLKVLYILDNTENEKILAECNFILGSIYIQRKNDIEAINNFNKSINYFNKDIKTKIKTKTYFELSRSYLNKSQFTKSEDAFNNIKKIGTMEDEKEEIIKYSLLRANDIFNYPEEKSKAVKILEDTLKLAKKINYKYIEDVYLHLGRAYWYEGRLVEGINAKLEALSIARGKNIESKIAKISVDIGIDYFYSGNYDEAVIYLSRILTYNLKDESEEAQIKCYALLNLVECYVKLKDYDRAKESINKLEGNTKKIKDVKIKDDFITNIYVSKADLNTEINKPSESMKLLNIAKYRYKKRNNFNFSNFDVKLCEEYGDVHYKLKNYEKALKYHKEVQQMALERDLSYLDEIYNNKIYLDYKAMGDYKNTILYLEKNIKLKTELSKNKNRQYSQYLINKFESEKNLEKISKLEESRNKMLLLFIGLGIATTVISTFLCFIYKQNKEINRLNKLFKDLSVTDALTKVHNRRALDEFLAVNWDLYKKTEMPISFMMIDLDFFKLYNDNYGHPKGDKVLEITAMVIKKSCRKVDFVARYGGEEFIVIMLNTDKNEAINLAKRIRRNIYDTNIVHEYSKVSDRITISMGISTACIGTNKNYDEYIQKSDNALYEAKSKGKDTYVYLH